jgi:hypothetical protein
MSRMCENVGASTSRNPKCLHCLYRDNFTLPYHSSYTVLLRCRGFHFSLDLFRIGRTPWTSDRPVARPPPKYRTTQTQNIRTHTHAYTKHPCPKWDSNPRYAVCINHNQNGVKTLFCTHFYRVLSSEIVPRNILGQVVRTMHVMWLLTALLPPMQDESFFSNTVFWSLKININNIIMWSFNC